MPDWIFSVDDKMSAAIRKIGDQQEHLTDKIEKSSAAVEKHHSALETLAELEIAKRVYEWGKSFIEFALDVHEGEAASRRLLDVIAGGKGLGDERFEELQRWGRQTKFTTEEIIGYQDKLFQFTRREGKEATDQVLLAAADLATLGPGGKAKADSLVQTMASISGRVKVTGRSLLQLSQTGIVSQRSLGETIAQELGIKGPKAAEEGLKRLESGVFDRTRAMGIALKAVNKDVDFGKGLGAASIEQATDSVQVQLKNIKASWVELFEGQNVAPLTDALGKIAHLLDKSQPSGQALGRIITEVFADATKVVEYASSHMDSWIAGVEKALHAVERIVGFVEAHPFLAKVAGAAFAGGAVGGKFGPEGALVGAAGAATFAAVGLTGEKIRDFRRDSRFAADADAFGDLNRPAPVKSVEIAPEIDVGKAQADAAAAGNNLAEGFTRGFSDNFDFGQLVEEKVLNAWDAKTETHSPSRWAMSRGKYLGEGLNIGFARSAHLALPDLGGGGAIGALGGGRGGRSITVNVPIHIAGGPHAAEHAENLSNAVRQAAHDGTMRALEEMAQQ